MPSGIANGVLQGAKVGSYTIIFKTCKAEHSQSPNRHVVTVQHSYPLCHSFLISVAECCHQHLSEILYETYPLWPEGYGTRLLILKLYELNIHIQIVMYPHCFKIISE